MSAPRAGDSRIAAVPRSCICFWVLRRYGNQHTAAVWVRAGTKPDCPWHT